MGLPPESTRQKIKKLERVGGEWAVENMSKMSKKIKLWDGSGRVFGVLGCYFKLILGGPRPKIIKILENQILYKIRISPYFSVYSGHGNLPLLAT